MIEALCIIVLILGVPFMIVGFLQGYFTKAKWFCHTMGWHLNPSIQGFDGCSSTGICPRCNEAVMQDGQGNWF
ncbi:MAG: hypothetical protein ACTSSP_01785 [Candidatus Asgardarchaeia archaeon]